MLRYLLYALAATFTFGVSAAMTDAYQTFVSHGFSPVRRILRIAPAPTADALPKLSARVDVRLRTSEREYEPGVVAIYFTTDADGRVNAAHVVAGDPSFHRQGVEAARGLRFSRRKYRGHFISTAGLVLYKFSGGRRIMLDLRRGSLTTCGTGLQSSVD